MTNSSQSALRSKAVVRKLRNRLESSAPTRDRVTSSLATAVRTLQPTRGGFTTVWPSISAPSRSSWTSNAIGPGKNFVERIGEAFGSADALIVVIGRHWANVTDETGRRQLDKPRDPVRIEIEQAIHQRISVIPLLVGGARMPSVEELPPALAPLTSLEALEISDNDWSEGVERLAAALTHSTAESGRSMSRPSRARE